MALGVADEPLAELEGVAVVLALFTLAFEEELEAADFDCGGAARMLVAFGVGVVVHCHMPPTFIQA